ncbi:MAG: hypothetical protein ACO3LG_07785, partial [Ilumatobacteraceae bacterium]
MTLAPDQTSATTSVISDALENQFGLADRVVDEAALANSVARFREQGIVLPTFAQLADPTRIDPSLVGDADHRVPMPATCGVFTGTTIW